MHLLKTIISLKSNIAAFNQKVQDIIQELATGEEKPLWICLLVYLFIAHLKVEDKEFVDFIKNLKMLYDDGHEVITVETLMDKAVNWYNQLVAPAITCKVSHGT